MIFIQKHLALLGHQVEDKVTKFRGVVASIHFDLYGCIQATVNPGLDKRTGKFLESHYLDVNRLKILSRKPVMDIPNFNYGVQAEGKQGSAEKPQISKV